MSYHTARYWLMRAQTRGIDGIYDKKASGNKCKLDSGQLKELKADLAAGPHDCGFESGVWTGPLVGWHIERKYGVKYSINAVYNLLRRLGFSWRTPRPERPKSASKEDQDKFKRPAPRPASTRSGATGRSRRLVFVHQGMEPQKRLVSGSHCSCRHGEPLASEVPHIRGIV